jgi:hypothetical protein
MDPSPCDACDSGILLPRKQYRLGLGFVIVGYTILALSVLALLYGVGVMVFAWALTQAGLPAEAQAVLDRARVPANIQGKVARREAIADSELKGLTIEQRKAVQDAQGRMGAQKLAFGFMAALIGASGAILGALSLPGLLVGGLLVLRRRVSVCDNCGAVTP